MEYAESFAARKRIVSPVHYETGEKFQKVVGPEPVDFINLLSSESEDEDNDDNDNNGGDSRNGSSSTKKSFNGNEGYVAATSIKTDNVRDFSMFLSIFDVKMLTKVYWF